MPLFRLSGNALTLVKAKNFKTEKELQRLIERNLLEVFNCRVVSSEFPTGQRHGGRIDTLALSEDNNPVIIEYKTRESSDLVNQSLFYLSWIDDHRGDFEVAATRALGKSAEIDWGDVRVICIAPGYKRYDIHAVQMMGANIELWQYRLYEGGAFFLEEVFRRGALVLPDSAGDHPQKNPVMVAAGRKAAATRATGRYTFEQHLANVSDTTRGLVETLREYILSLGEGVEEAPKKYYVAYKTTQNFACMEIRKNKVLLFLKLVPSEIKPLPLNARDVSKIGTIVRGDVEVSITAKEDLSVARDLVLAAFRRIGG